MVLAACRLLSWFDARSRTPILKWATIHSVTKSLHRSSSQQAVMLVSTNKFCSVVHQEVFFPAGICWTLLHLPGDCRPSEFRFAIRRSNAATGSRGPYSLLPAMTLLPKNGRPKDPAGSGSDRFGSREDPGQKMRLYCFEMTTTRAAPRASSIFRRGVLTRPTELPIRFIFRVDEELPREQEIALLTNGSKRAPSRQDEMPTCCCRGDERTTKAKAPRDVKRRKRTYSSPRDALAMIIVFMMLQRGLFFVKNFFKTMNNG